MAVLSLQRVIMRNDRRDSLKSLTKFVMFSFACLIIYTIVSQVIAWKTGTELSTLTTCFFGAFGGEVLMCALIKIFKLKGDGENGNSIKTDAGVQCNDEPDYGSPEDGAAR